MSNDSLVERARAAALSAYAPYSRFSVGCAIESVDGEIAVGSNMENACYRLGVSAKRTGPRYINDENLPLQLCTAAFVNVVDCNATRFTVYGAKLRPYTTVDIGARLPLGFVGLNDDTYFQFNVTNVFDTYYVGNVTNQLLNTSVPFAQIGAPRAFIATLNVAFR